MTTGPIFTKSLFPRPRLDWFSATLLLIFLVALALRIAVSIELFHNDVQVSRPSGGTDMATYVELSRKIADGSFSGPFYYQPFYYAVFLPAIIFVFGKGVLPVLLVQSFISALTVLFAALSAAMLGGRRAGAIAAILATFSSCLCLYVPYHLIETMQAFWIVLIAYISILASRRGDWRLWGVCGLIVSFSILSRGNIWFLVPGIALASFLGGMRRGRPILFPLLFLAMVVLPQLPFSCWNHLRTGKLSGPSTAAGAVLGLGNTPEAPPGGRNPGLGAGPMEYPETYLDWSGHQDETGIAGRIREWAFSEPLAFLELQFRKVLLFWDHREIPNNIAFEHNGMKSLVWRFLCFVPTSVLLCGFVAWVVSAFLNFAGRFRPRNLATPSAHLFSPTLLCAYCVLAYWLATAAFYNLARFRNPSLPLLAIFAGIFADDAVRTLRSGDESRGRRIRIAVLSMIFAVFVVFFSFDAYRYYEPCIMKMARPRGTRVELSGGRTLILDNGPFTFGGWEMLELKEGMRIEKIFEAGGLGHGRTARFALDLFFLVPGEMIFDMNGKECRVSAENGGQLKKILELGELDRPVVTITVKRLDCQPFALLDRQRDYRRTLLDGKPAGGELVSSLNLFDKRDGKTKGP